MIKTIGQIITLLFTSLLRIWIIRQVFYHNERKTIIHTSLISIWSVLLLAGVYRIEQKYFTKTISFIIISSIITWSIIITRLQSKRFLWWIGQTIVVFLSTAIPFQNTYKILAWIEESSKRHALQKNTDLFQNKVIFLSIISGLSFWRAENIIYLIMTKQEEFMTVLSSRSFIPIVVHIWFMCISYLSAEIIFKKTKKTILGWSIWLSIGVILHALFNISQKENIWLISISIIVLCIFAVSYGIAKSDMIYEQQWLN